MCFEDFVEVFKFYLFFVSYSFVIRILEIGCGILDFSLKFFEYLNCDCCIDCIDFLYEVIKILRKIVEECGVVVKEIVEIEGKLEFSFDLIGLVCY